MPPETTINPAPHRDTGGMRRRDGTGWLTRRSAFVAAKIVSSLGLVWFILHSVDLGVVVSALRDIPPAVAVEVLLLLSLQPLLLAWRWQQIITMLGAPMPFREALRLTFVGLFFNQVLPTSIGGDALRFWGARRSGIDTMNAAGSVLIDRATGLLTVAILVAAALVVAGGSFDDPLLRMTLFALAPLGIAATVLVVSLESVIIRWLPRSLKQLVITLVGGLRTILFTGQGRFILFFLSVLTWLPVFMSIWAMSAALGLRLDLADAVIVGGGSLLFAALPVSIGGWGVRELAMVTLVGATGALAEQGLVMSVILATLTMAVSLPGGLLWLTIRRTAAPAGPATTTDSA